MPKWRRAYRTERVIPCMGSVSVPSRSKKRYFLYILLIKSPAFSGNRTGVYALSRRNE